MPFQKTISDLRKILENKSVNIPKEINRKASEIEESTLSQYHGIYEFRDLDTKIAVAIENGRLTLYQDGDKIASMFAENDSTFFEKPDDEELFEFRRNEDGSFDALMGFKGVKLPGKKID